jgi:hypothetical protein
MFRVDLGKTKGYCDGLSRRSFLTLGAAGMASTSLGGFLRAKNKETNQAGSDPSVILIWLDGGPGHMDMYDMKPDAPEEYRGIWKPIGTTVPGMQITELFPRQARLAHLFSLVRSLHHDTGDHFAGGHRMLTSKDLGVSGANTAGKFPSIGSIIERELGSRKPGVPGYVGLPHAASIGLTPGYFGGHFLGKQYDPFQPGGDPNADSFKVQNLELAQGLDFRRLEDRTGLSRTFDTFNRSLEKSGTLDAMDRFDRGALDFVRSHQSRIAFDISREDPRLRDHYGRHTWGQSMLLARRLVEAGSSFVTVHLGGWDHHWDLKSGMENYLPKVDDGVAALLEDLKERGLLETTLVVLCGEFSRTPKMNDGGNGGPAGSKGTPGRDHWGNSMFCFLAGGGVQGGRIIGSTDRLGQSPKSRPLTPSNIHASIYKVMGIDPHLSLLEPSGRPIPVLDDPSPIDELF